MNRALKVSALTVATTTSVPSAARVSDKTAKVEWKWVTAYKAKDTMLLNGVDELQT